MSHYDWEHGTITLPSAEAPRIRKALIAATNEVFDTARAMALEFRQTNPTRSVKKWAAALTDWEHRLNAPRPYYRRRRPDDALRTHVAHRVIDLLYRTGPKKPTMADLESEFPHANNKTRIFHVGAEATISFDDRKVTWHVPENNRAAEHAHADLVARAFFAALAKVNWTRSSGGRITGNDEYNRDSYDDGAGSNYTIMEFPPPAPIRTRSYGKYSR